MKKERGWGTAKSSGREERKHPGSKRRGRKMKGGAKEKNEKETKRETKKKGK